MLPFAVPAIDQRFVGASYVLPGAIQVGSYGSYGTSQPLAAYGVKIGDLGVALGNVNSGGGAWATIASGVSYRQISAGDMGGFGSYGASVVFYRGAGSLKATTSASAPGNNDTSNTFLVPGYAKDPRHVGMLAYFQGSSTNGETPDGSPIGTGWAARAGSVTGAGGGTSFAGLSDFLYPPAALYANGTSITIGHESGDTSMMNYSVALIEILSA